MVDRITSGTVGRTTMSVIPYTSTETAEVTFEEVMDHVSGVTKSKDGMELEGIFEEASNIYGVPVYLLKAVAQAESDFNVNAVSRSGAMGIMQLMPETAKELGVENAFDPEENIMGGAKYLSEKLKQYSGNIELTLAAYNAGSGNVEKYGGIPPFEETQNYVKKVTSYMEEYRQGTASGSMVNSVSDADTVLGTGAVNTSKAGNAAVSADISAAGYAGNNQVLSAYERLRDETYWKVLK